MAALAHLRERATKRYSPVKANADHGVLIDHLRRHIDVLATEAGMRRETAAEARRQAVQLFEKLPDLIVARSEALAIGITVAAGLANDETASVWPIWPSTWSGTPASRPSPWPVPSWDWVTCYSTRAYSILKRVWRPPSCTPPVRPWAGPWRSPCGLTPMRCVRILPRAGGR